MDDTVRVQTKLRELVAEEVRALLARRRLNGAKLAESIGRSEMYVSRRLRGETAFDLDDLQRIADVLGVSPTDLLPPAGPKAASLTYPDGRHAPRTPVSLITGHHRPVTPRIADHRLRRPERVN